MNFWITLWTGMLIVSLGVFAAVAVVVSVRGFYDVKTLLSTIRKQHESSQSESKPD